jgi:hypothetical protein
MEEQANVWHLPWPSTTRVELGVGLLFLGEDKCEWFMGDGPVHVEGMNK